MKQASYLLVWNFSRDQYVFHLIQLSKQLLFLM